MTQSSNSSALAVIGSGGWGKNLVRNFHELGALRLVCDTDDTILAQLNIQYPGIETCLAFSDVLRRPDITAVVIATPAETHAVLVREALLSGKHVFVEKPLALSFRDGEELTALAEHQRLTLMVGHLLLYHPAFVKLKELAFTGELGRINYIYSNRLNLGRIRREENILWSFAPHDIAMILALAAEEPDQVWATGGNYLHRHIADVTTTHLEFPSGLRAHVFVSWLHPFKEQKLVVVGDRSMAVFDDTRPWERKLLLYPHEIAWKDHKPVPSKVKPEQIAITQEEPLRLECRHFLECITERKRPRTDGHEGLRVLKVLNSCQQLLDSHTASPIPTSFSTRSLDYFAHETAVIDDGVHIGQGTKIWHFSHILTGSHIGDTCNIGQNVVIGPDVRIGKQCKIQNNVSVYHGVTLEDGVFCGPSMVFTNVRNPRAEIRKMDQVRETLLKHGATVGANATIVCGVTLGRYCFVGAGAVVTKDVPDYALVIGNPARPIGWVCGCGERLQENLRCPVCGKQYQRRDDELMLIE
ncbi:MAG: Gfo/Idh/MocA family oxidoreductase [bacterium]|nr:Gfo/Idh/MocA family oxidoreductase [bacterium]